MSNSKRALFAALPSAALFVLAGCGGGGSSAPPTLVVKPTTAPSAAPSATPVPVTPGVPAAPGPATFTVYTAAVDGQTLVSMAPYGALPDTTHVWAIAPGAYVIYPDKSIQVTDTTGSFDASKSGWTTLNAPAVALNPNASPQVRILVPGSAVPAVPLYSAVFPLNSFDSTLPAGGAVPATFRDVVVVPSSAAMFDDETRVFEAVGQDNAGGVVDIDAAVTWSLQLPAGCTGSPAGSLVINSHASIATYKPPANGVFTNACYDIVVASIPNANPSSPISSSASALYYATSQAVPISGKVVNGASPIANGVVDLYGGSPVLGFGDFLALTDKNGAFSRNVPPQRPLTAFVDNVTVSAVSPAVNAFAVTPTSVVVGATGAKPAPVTLVEGGPFVTPYAPLPAGAFTMINSFDIGNAALLDVPFGLPNTAGVLPACSVGAFADNQSTVAACGGVVKGGGVYGGWAASVAIDSATGGNDFTFLQPPSASGQQVLSVKTNITAYTDPNGSGADATAPVCSTTTPCAAYARYYSPSGFGSSLPGPLVPANLPANTVLQIDGVFIGVLNPSTSIYTVNLIRNVYSGSFQVLGQPQRAHAEAFSYPYGATSVAFTDHWYNPLDQEGGSFSFNRTQTASGYSLAGNGTQSYFRSGYAPTVIGYTLTNGAVNLSPGAVSETYTTTSTINANTQNVNWAWTGLPGLGSTASGGITNGTGASQATFSVDAAEDVTLTESPSNGGGIQQFIL